MNSYKFFAKNYGTNITRSIFIGSLEYRKNSLLFSDILTVYLSDAGTRGKFSYVFKMYLKKLYFTYSVKLLCYYDTLLVLFYAFIQMLQNINKKTIT